MNMGKRRGRTKLRINKRNIILNNYTMSKVIQQYFNNNTKKIPGNPLGNRNKAQITLLDRL